VFQKALNEKRSRNHDLIIMLAEMKLLSLSAYTMPSLFSTFSNHLCYIVLDHTAPEFIASRQAQLNFYLKVILDIPHVQDMECVKSFLGITEKVCFSFVLPLCLSHQTPN